MLRHTLLAGLFLLVTGCAYLPTSSIIHNREQEYLSAKSIPPLRTPPGVSSESFHGKYTVSETQFQNSKTNIGLVPPGLN